MQKNVLAKESANDFCASLNSCGSGTWWRARKNTPSRKRAGKSSCRKTLQNTRRSYWPGNLCLLGRHEVPHSTVLFCAVSTKYLMIVFIFYRTPPALSCPFLPALRNRSVALFDGSRTRSPATRCGVYVPLCGDSPLRSFFS